MTGRAGALAAIGRYRRASVGAAALAVLATAATVGYVTAPRRDTTSTVNAGGPTTSTTASAQPSTTDAAAPTTTAPPSTNGPLPTAPPSSTVVALTPLRQAPATASPTSAAPTTVPAMSVLPVQSPSRVQTISPDVVWVTGMQAADGPSPRAVVAGSADGGRTWRWSCLPGGSASTYFLDDTAGWAALPDAFSSSVLATTDGARSWTRRGQLPLSVSRIHFSDREHGWAVGTLPPPVSPPTEPRSSAGVAVTSDGGSIWTVRLLPAELNVGAAWFTDPDHVVVVGSRPGPAPVAYTSADAGSTWTPADLPPGQNNLSDMTGDGSTLWAAGTSLSQQDLAPTGASLLRSDDGGRTWSAVAAPAASVSAMSLSDGRIAMAGQSTAFEPALFVTSDHGTTWRDLALTPARRGSFASVAVAGDRIWAVGDQGVMRVDGDVVERIPTTTSPVACP